MILSAVGFFENIFAIGEFSLTSQRLIPVVLSLIIGNTVGEAMKLEDRLSSLSGNKTAAMGAFVDATLFFGVGGLQVSGPIVLALTGDSGQLYLKSLIDFPFALMFGASYGAVAAASALPVAAVQILTLLAAGAVGALFTDAAVSQLCAMGYIILFFSGYNLLCESNRKVKNVNMLPGIFIIILFSLAEQLLGIYGG